MHNNENIMLCNGATLHDDSKSVTTLVYDYDSNYRNIEVGLPKFVSNVYHLQNKIKDLLEIASYVMAADRLVLRGSKEAVEYHSWSRNFHFIIKVRDYNFWNNVNVQLALTELLNFSTGDNNYRFTFLEGHETEPVSLFDNDEFKFQTEKNYSIVLFSGGLDSLTGIIERLETTNEKLCLISHRSRNPGTAKTQDKLFQALKRDYPARIKHYKFYCHLYKSKRGTEETQRSRTFLYTSIAYSIAHALGINKFYIYENGITSINIPKRPDLINARASRTTHPKTIGLLKKFFNTFSNKEFDIVHPYLWSTKTDLFLKLNDFNKCSYIDSTVSCIKTYQRMANATHCGMCSQCIDRRFASFGSELEKYDTSTIYNFDFINSKISDGPTKTNILDYIRQARDFNSINLGAFYNEKLEYIVDIEEFIDGETEEEKIDKLYQLFKKHGGQVEKALERIRSKYNKPFGKNVPEQSLLAFIDKKEYLNEPIKRLIREICSKLIKSIPKAYAHSHPKNETELNDLINSLIESEKDSYGREFPTISFGLTRIIPDHSIFDLLIEAKYIRKNTPPSVATKGIAEDMTKYRKLNKDKLFIVYDPNRAISDDEKYSKSLEDADDGKSKVFIIR